MILPSQGIFTISEKATSKGRADIVTIYKENCFVLELKYCRDKTGNPIKKAEKLLESAVGQIIEKRYGKEILGKNVTRMAMVFSEQERQFVKWQQVD